MAQNIRINFGINGKITADQLDKVNNSLKKIGRQGKNISVANVAIAKTGKNAAIAAKGVGLLKTQLGGLVLAYAGFSAVSSSVRNIVDFNRAVAEVQTIARLTAPELKKVNDEILNLAIATGKGPTELMKAFYQIQSAGIKDSAAATNVLAASAKLSVAGIAGMESTINAVTKILSSYNGQFKDASEITDVFFDAVELGQVKVEDLAMGLPQVASLAKTLGLSFKDVTGAVSAFSKKAGTASLGVTQLRSVLVGIVKGQDRARSVLKENAASFSLQALASKRLAIFLRELNTVADKDIVALRKLFGRVEAITGIAGAATDNFKDLEKIMGMVGKEAGSSEKAFKKISTSVGGVIDRIAATKKALDIKFGAMDSGLLLESLNLIHTSMVKLFDNMETVVRNIKSMLLTVGVIAFVIFARRGVMALIALRTAFITTRITAQKELIAMRAAAATSLTGIAVSTKVASVSLKSFVVALKASKVAVNLLKASVTLGLSFALDFVILKMLEMKDQFGGWENLFTVFKMNAKIAFAQLGLFIDEAGLKFWELNRAVVNFVSGGLVKLGKAIGMDVKNDSLEAFKKTIDASKKSVKGTRLEVAKLKKELEQFKFDKDTTRDRGFVGPKIPKKLDFGGKKGVVKTGEIPGIPDTDTVKNKLQSVRDQILLFNEETRLILNERAMLEADEDFAFLQKRLGTEKALKAVANKEALKGTKKAKLAELEFERKIAEEKKKAALAEIRFSELSNKEKLKQTQNTLGLMLGLTQAAGKKFFAITKTIAISESIVSGILAVQKALAGSSPPLNFINAGIVGATVALNTAKLVSSKPPSFRTGGIVPGTPTGGRDSVLANVEPREAVLTQAQQRNFLRLADGEGANNNQLIEAFNRLADVLVNKETNIEIDGRQVALAMRDQRLAGVTI